MAIRIISINRLNPLPCQHFLLTADVNGRTVERPVTLEQISAIDLDDAVMRIVKYYAVDRGQGLAGVVGKTILPDTLP